VEVEAEAEDLIQEKVEAEALVVHLSMVLH
jgi:hypothetical protein